MDPRAYLRQNEPLTAVALYARDALRDAPLVTSTQLYAAFRPVVDVLNGTVRRWCHPSYNALLAALPHERLNLLADVPMTLQGAPLGRDAKWRTTAYYTDRKTAARYLRSRVKEGALSLDGLV